MALTAGKIKCYVSSILLFYVFYLYYYQCAKLKESTLEHVGETVLHPLTHHHSRACELLAKGESFVQPYVTVAHNWLDDHVHSHPLFIEYKIEDKIACGKSQLHKYLDPALDHLFGHVATVETLVYDHVTDHYNQLVKRIKN